MGDTLAPVGPYIADRTEIPDPHVLDLKTWVNGTLMQDGNTRNFIFDIGYIIQYLTNIMTLSPGDLIATGTPAGRGLLAQAAGHAAARRPPEARDHRARHAREHREGRLGRSAPSWRSRSFLHYALEVPDQTVGQRYYEDFGLVDGTGGERCGAPAARARQERDSVLLYGGPRKRLHHLCYGAPGRGLRAGARRRSRRAGVAEIDPPARAPPRAASGSAIRTATSSTSATRRAPALAGGPAARRSTAPATRRAQAARG